MVNRTLPKRGQFCGLASISDYATVCQASALRRVCQETATNWYCNPSKELVNASGRGEGCKEKVYWCPELQALFLNGSNRDRMWP